MGKKMRVFFGLLVMFLAVGLASAQTHALPPEPTAHTTPRSVLVLWSYPRVFPWSLELDEHLNKLAKQRLNTESEFAPKNVTVEEEFLPFEPPGGQWSDSYVQYIQEKYKQRRFDKLVINGTVASEFVRQHPKVFFADDFFEVATSSGGTDSTLSQKTQQSWAEIDSFFTPEAQKTLVIANEGSILNVTHSLISKGTSWFDAGRFRLLDPIAYDLTEIRTILSELDKDWRILYLPVSATKEQASVIPAQYLSELTSGLDKPVLCSASSLVGAGCVAAFGESARLFAHYIDLAIYNQNPVPFVQGDLHELILDEAKLKELGFNRPKWYDRALVMNPQSKFMEQYGLTIAVGLCLSALFGFVTFIFWGQAQKLKTVTKQERSKSLRLQHILKGTNVGTWEWNVQTGETRFNERWAEIIGYSLDELGPTSIETWMAYAHPEDLEGSEQKLNDHFQGKSDFYELEARMKHKEGHWVWVLDRGQVATWSADGKPEWMFGTHQEITERKTLEEELTRRTLQAENALKVKSEFLAAMSHEIRTPMNGVLGLAELAKKSISPKAKHYKYVDGILRSGKLLMGILNDILDFSRLEAGRTKLQLESFDVRALFKECEELFSAAAQEKSLSLSVQISPSAPQRLFGDPIRLAQMVNNYIGNALKFTSHGAVSATVEVKPVDGRCQLRFDCKDSGCGIDLDAHSLLFKPFSQVSNDPKAKATGTGLGLALVQEYAKLMGGQCGAKSTPGVGSLFWFEVFLDEAEPENKKDIEVKEIDLETIKGKHVLIVEDTEMNVWVLQEILSQLGITSEVAGNGLEAVERFERGVLDQSKPFDLILMDVQMPVMDGLEATKLLKLKFKEVPPIIGLSAGVLHHQIEQCKEAGMDSFLAKPINTEELSTQLCQLSSKNTQSN